VTAFRASTPVKARVIISSCRQILHLLHVEERVDWKPTRVRARNRVHDKENPTRSHRHDGHQPRHRIRESKTEHVDKHHAVHARAYRVASVIDNLTQRRPALCPSRLFPIDAIRRLIRKHQRRARHVHPSWRFVRQTRREPPNHDVSNQNQHQPTKGERVRRDPHRTPTFHDVRPPLFQENLFKQRRRRRRILVRMHLRTRALMRTNVCAFFVCVALGVFLRSVVSTEREKVKSRPPNRFKKHGELVHSFARRCVYLAIYISRVCVSLARSLARSNDRLRSCLPTRVLTCVGKTR